MAIADLLTGKELKLPGKLLLTCLSIALLLPLIARLPGVPFGGWDWLMQYLPDPTGLVFSGIFNAIPAFVLYGLGRLSKQAPLAFWAAATSLSAFLLWAHGGIDLRSSSTAAIALIIVPIYAVGPVILGWLVGWVINKLVTGPQARVWILSVAASIAIALSVGTAAWSCAQLGARDSRFPITAVNTLSLVEHNVVAKGTVGRINAMATVPAHKGAAGTLLALGDSAIYRVEQPSGVVLSKSDLDLSECRACIRMYPYLFDSNGKTQLATSDGLSDEHGHFLWRNRAEGFSRTVPLHGGNGQIFFVDYETQDRVELRRADGAVSWSMKLPAEDVGMYKSLDGTELPFVITGYRDARKVTVFNLLGGISQVIAMPEWAASVQSIAWPNPGNLLVGAGDWLAVIDPNGREVFKHVIQNTSFAPYHGPDGVVVHFKPNAPPFLVVASHGSSGFARSVILIFDAKGTLVWQRETDRISSLVSVPIAAEGREVLWTGGMDAITEYSLSPSAQH